MIQIYNNDRVTQTSNIILNKSVKLQRKEIFSNTFNAEHSETIQNTDLSRSEAL